MLRFRNKGSRCRVEQGQGSCGENGKWDVGSGKWEVGRPIGAHSDTVGHRHVTAAPKRCRAGRAQGRESHRTDAVLDAPASERRRRESRACLDQRQVVGRLLSFAVLIAVPRASAPMIALAEELAAVLGHLLLCYTQAPAGTKPPSAPTSFWGSVWGGRSLGRSCLSQHSLCSSECGTKAWAQGDGQREIEGRLCSPAQVS